MKKPKTTVKTSAQSTKTAVETSAQSTKTSAQPAESSASPSQKPLARPSRKSSSKLRNLLGNTIFTLFLCILIYGVIYLVTLLVSSAMKLLLGDRAVQTVWVSAYQAISYILVLTVLLLIPKFIKFCQKLSLKTASKTESIAQKSALKPVQKPAILKLRALLEKSTLASAPSRDQLGLTGLPTWTDIGLAPIAFIAALIVGQALLALFSLIFPWFDANEAQAIGYSTTIFGFDRLLAFFSLCVVAPVAEELIFRGWLYGKQRQKTGAIFAIIFNAIFFGFLHGQWNVALTVGALGAASCLLREITGTAYAGILLHVLKNSIAFVLLFVYGI